MDIHKLILYINILGICFPVALTYVMIINIIFGITIQPVSLVILALGYAVMIKHNMLFRELWEKWKNRN
ncbi:hypothetical protein ACLM5H_19480 [Fredinandcohnia humi]